MTFEASNGGKWEDKNAHSFIAIYGEIQQKHYLIQYVTVTTSVYYVVTIFVPSLYTNII